MTAVTRMDHGGIAGDHGNERGHKIGHLLFLYPAADGVGGPEDHPDEEDENQVRVVDPEYILENVADEKELREGAHRAPREVLFQPEPEDNRASARDQDENETQKQLYGGDLDQVQAETS